MFDQKMHMLQQELINPLKSPPAWQQFIGEISCAPLFYSAGKEDHFHPTKCMPGGERHGRTCLLPTGELDTGTRSHGKLQKKSGSARARNGKVMGGVDGRIAGSITPPRRSLSIEKLVRPDGAEKRISGGSAGGI